jgi:hypothetical protein
MLMEYDNADQTLPAHLSTQVRVTESNRLVIDGGDRIADSGWVAVQQIRCGLKARSA